MRTRSIRRSHGTPSFSLRANRGDRVVRALFGHSEGSTTVESRAVPRAGDRLAQRGDNTFPITFISSKNWPFSAPANSPGCTNEKGGSRPDSRVPTAGKPIVIPFQPGRGGARRRPGKHDGE